MNLSRRRAETARGAIVVAIALLLCSFVLLAHAKAEELLPMPPARPVFHAHHLKHEGHRRHHRHKPGNLHQLSTLPPSQILTEAARYIGSPNPSGFRGKWCAAFVNMILRATGHAVTGSLRAIDGLLLGERVADPQPGDIAILRIGRHGHHETFFAGWGGRGFYGLGGNQGHIVRVSRFSRRQVIAFIHPTEEE
jgi:uncharacterized protein (TIGR02594 family)